jgi:hypothetical protein
MDDKLEKSLLKITDALRKQIINLHSQKSSGNIDITVRLSMSQGFIGAAKLRNVAEENIFQSK